MFRSIIAISLVSAASFAYGEEDTISYIAKNNGENKFCARVEEPKFGRIFKVRRCRTLDEWVQEGYDVSYWTKINQDYSMVETKERLA